MEQRRESQAAVALFLFGCLAAIGIALWLPFTVGFEGRFEALNAAKSLADTGTLANPFSLGITGPTAHVAPVFPALAAILRWLPFEWNHTLIALSVLLCGLNAALLPYAAEALWRDWRPGAIGGVLSVIAFVLLPQNDGELSSVLAVVACIAIAKEWRSAGVLAGIAVLTNPVNGLALAPLLMFEPWRKRWKPVVLVAALVCTPWVVRNWVQLGFPAPVRDNFGMELSLANNDCAGAGVADAPECFMNRHPGYSQAEFERVRALGEAGYNQARLREALAWMEEHPAKAAGLAVRRARRYFLPPLEDGPATPGICLVTVIVVAGLASRQLRWRNPLIVGAVLVWLPYVLIQPQTDARYRAYSMWIWCLLAGLVCSTGAQRKSTS